jgi:hypothetical protein
MSQPTSAWPQTNTPPSKAETRLITLGTVAGPPPRPHRAQFSNLLIVNDTLYVIDAGDGVTCPLEATDFDERLTKLERMTESERSVKRAWEKRYVGIE